MPDCETCIYHKSLEEVAAPMILDLDEALEHARQLRDQGRKFTQSRAEIVRYFRIPVAHIEEISNTPCGLEFESCQIALAAIQRLSQLSNTIPKSVRKLK